MNFCLFFLSFHFLSTFFPLFQDDRTFLMRFLIVLAIFCMAVSTYAYEVALLASPDSSIVHCDDLSSDLALQDFLEPLLTRKNKQASLDKKVPVVDFVHPPENVKVLFIEDVVGWFHLHFFFSSPFLFVFSFILFCLVALSFFLLTHSPLTLSLLTCL